jgi:hypothetical protein
MTVSKFIIIIALIQFLFFPLYFKEENLNNPEKYTIENDGFHVFYNNNNYTNLDCNLYLPLQTKTYILNLLPPGYVFLNYSYTIKDSSLYTFHRDVTSSRRFQNLVYPSYTLIVYFFKGKHLSICRNSHKSNFIIPKPITISGNYDQYVLFDADMVHASALSDNTKRYCKQYKIAHKNDIKKLNHIQNTHLEKINTPRKHTLLEYIIRLLSHRYIFLFDIPTIGSFIEKKRNNIILNYISNQINLTFYNNKIE